MIFVDTSAWSACVMPSDPNHPAAANWLQSHREPLLTTDYVVDEALTLLKARGQFPRAVALGDELLQGRRTILHDLAENDVRQAWNVFRQFQDKDWSFTDCTSKVVMEKLAVTQAFAFDHHFHQFGSLLIVP